MTDIDIAAFEKLRRRITDHRAAMKVADPIKTAFVLPFIAALGYDVFDPAVLVPAYSASGSPKVDYAVLHGEHVRMIAMLASAPSDHGAESVQRAITSALTNRPDLVLLTDGSVFNVHVADGEGAIQAEPTLSIDLSDPNSSYDGLEHLDSEAHDPQALQDTANQRRLVVEIRQALRAELADPSDATVDAVGARLPYGLSGHPGIRDAIIHASRPAETPVPQVDPDEPKMSDVEEQAFQIIRAIAAELIDPERVVARPAKSYVAVLLDDNNRRPLARIHFKSSRSMAVGTFVRSEETRNPIDGVTAVYRLKEPLLAQVSAHLAGELEPRAGEPPE